MMKKCTKCKKKKRINEFCAQAKAGDGLHSWCRACAGVYHRRWQREHRSLVNETHTKWRRKNYRKWRVINRRAKLRGYGLTESSYAALKKVQNNRCAICGVDETSSRCPAGRLGIDHDHSTGKVRGLLCSRCNSAIGLLYDCPEILQSAARYLEHFYKK